MEDWTRIIGTKLSEMEMPLSEVDWSSLQRKYAILQRNRKRGRVFILCGLISAAAVIVLFLLFPGKHPGNMECKPEWSCVVAQADPEVVLPLINMHLEAINIKSRGEPNIVRVSDVDTITNQNKNVVQEVGSKMKSIDKKEDRTENNKLYSDDLFEFEDDYYTPKRRLVSLGVEGSGGLMGIRRNFFMLYMPIFGADIVMKKTYNHSFPIMAGISARFYLMDRLSLNTGLNYTLYASKYYTLYNNGIGTEEKQQVHYLGIPLTIDYSIIKRKYFTFYIGAGVSVDKCIKAYIGDTTLKEGKLLFSFLGNLGLQYDITNYFGLYFEPDVMIRLNQGVIRTFRYENIATLSARAGLRFTF
jgi:hypothetical protein